MLVLTAHSYIIGLTIWEHASSKVSRFRLGTAADAVFQRYLAQRQDDVGHFVTLKEAARYE